MAQILVRNLNDQLKKRLQSHARRNGRSMEAETREILRNVLREEDAPAGGLGTKYVLASSSVITACSP